MPAMLGPRTRERVLEKSRHMIIIVARDRVPRIPDAKVGGVNFLYIKIILQDGTKSDQDITWLRRSKSKKSISTES